jgi:hypothetical protein
MKFLEETQNKTGHATGRKLEKGQRKRKKKGGKPLHFLDRAGCRWPHTMPRQLRIQYPGAIHHVMSRGNRREDIFLDDVDRQDFLKTLAEACQKTGWQVHA